MRTVFLRRGLVALFAAAVSFGAIVQAQAETLRIGYQKYGTLVLLKAKGSLEKRLAQQGVEVQWTEFPGGPQLLEGLNVGSIDFGVTGETPPVFAQAAGADLLYVAYEPPAPHSEAILVPKGSPIQSVQDLKGKTVGVSLGGDPQSALFQMLMFELGVQDIKDTGIKFVNMPTHAQAASVPTGVDATCTIYPAYLAAQASGTVAIANSFGFTEEYYDGPAGKGAGHMLASVKKSPFFPDGYYLHRSFWIGRNGLIEQHPQAVVAFLMAQQDAVAALTAMDSGAVSQLVKDYWKLDAAQGAKVVKDDVLFSRGWSWPTENDARAILETSKFMAGNKVIDKPLQWSQIKNAFSRTAPLIRQAYDKLGAKPAAAEFTRTDVADLRGRPVWEIEKWADRS